MLSARTATIIVGRRRAAAAALSSISSSSSLQQPSPQQQQQQQQQRRLLSGDSPKLPFGLDKILGEPDNLIPTDRERKTKKSTIPDYAPPDVRKDLEELGLDGIEDLDELEEKNMEGYNELGLVPPEGAGSFISPILIPSRMAERKVGYCDPETHAMFWFTIHNDDNIYYIKDLGLFFKMLPIPDEDAAAAHH